MRNIPNIITSLNLASGFTAIIFILHGDPVTASWLILAAMIFDFLDGFAARVLKSYSDMGKELDSLADAVSFGVAPGLIVYHLLVVASEGSSLFSTGSGSSVSLIYLAVAAIMPVCAALRLAKFNIDPTQAKSFKGLPTPANALAVVSVVIASEYGNSELVSSFSEVPLALAIFSLALSILMVTRIPLFSLKFSNLQLRDNYERFSLILVSILLLIILGIGGIPWIIPAYIIISLLSLLI